MTYTRKNRGVCSNTTTVEIDENGVLQSVQVTDGCDGNLQGVCALLQGVPAKEAIHRLEGIRCEGKPTSCPHQIALCISEAMAQQSGAAPAAKAI